MTEQNMMQPQQPLNSHHRARLAAIADIIVPRAGGMPSASDIDLVNAPLDKVLRARPDLLEPLRQMLDSLNGEVIEKTVTGLQRSEPETFDVLMQVVAGAYYIDSHVRRLLGYDGQRALSLPRSGFGAEELLMVVMESPPRYRDPDELVIPDSYSFPEKTR